MIEHQRFFLKTQEASPTKYTYKRTGREIIATAKMVNLQTQGVICILSTYSTHIWTSLTPPAAIKRQLSSRQCKCWKLCVCMCVRFGICTRTNSQPNNFELSPRNNLPTAATLAPVPKTVAYGCHRPKQDVVSRQENYTITRPT